MSARLPDRGVMVNKQQPNSPLLHLGDSSDSPFVPTIRIPADFQQLGNLQLALIDGPFWMQAEWYGSLIDQGGGDPVSFMAGTSMRAISSRVSTAATRDVAGSSDQYASSAPYRRPVRRKADQPGRPVAAPLTIRRWQPQIGFLAETTGQLPRRPSWPTPGGVRQQGLSGETDGAGKSRPGMLPAGKTIRTPKVSSIRRPMIDDVSRPRPGDSYVFAGHFVERPIV